LSNIIDAQEPELVAAVLRGLVGLPIGPGLS
jgi:hypothetical protein